MVYAYAYAWAKAFNRSALDDHFRHHGEQMGCSTKEPYNANAVKFANTVDRKNNVSFVSHNGTIYKYNKADGSFAIITKRGVVITYFKPKDGYDYYKAQIERARK